MSKLRLFLAALALTGISVNGADTKNDPRPQAGGRAEQRRVAGDIERRIQAINRLDNDRAALLAGMAAVSKETAVPLPTIEAEHKDHPQLGLAGLFVAHLLAVKTHKPVDQLIKQRQSGRTWTQLARTNMQDLADLEKRLGHIEQAMRNPGASGVNTDTSVDRTPVRETASEQSELDRRIAALNSLDDKPVVMRTGLQVLSKETATPLPQLEELQKQHTTAGIGDLFVAQELAVRTHKPANELLNSHAAGKTWAQIIAEQNQDRNVIEQKLSRIEQTMRDADKQ